MNKEKIIIVKLLLIFTTILLTVLLHVGMTFCPNAMVRAVASAFCIYMEIIELICILTVVCGLIYDYLVN